MVNHVKNVKKHRGLWWKIPLAVIVTLVLIVLGYLLYVIMSYNRIEDQQPLIVEGTATQKFLSTEQAYTAVTYNIGFGAYTPDFTFFMDGGTQSWANSKESVEHCIRSDVELLKAQQADFLLLQEVDFDSTRSYHVNQAESLRQGFHTMCSTLAVNYHSPFLFYPLYQPHGASNAGLLTLSDVQITSGMRYSLPIAESFSKYLDLDRCFSLQYIPVDGGKELVLVNVHTSAYGTDGDLQKQQLTKLFDAMRQEYDKGNYVVCAGDFNHDFTGNSTTLFNREVSGEYTWAAPFPDELIPEHFVKLTNYTGGTPVPSCRNCDKPYGKDCFTLIVDGFIVSDNVRVTYMDILDNGFAYSDHNPVKLTFSLSK